MEIQKIEEHSHQNGVSARRKQVYIIGAVICIVLALGAGAYVWYDQSGANDTVLTNTSVTINTNTTTNTTEPSANQNSQTAVSNSVANTATQTSPTNATIDEVANGVLRVDWDDQLEKIDEVCTDYCASNNYRAGVVTSGEYKGYTVYLKEELGLGYSYSHYILKDNIEHVFGEEVKLSGIDDVPTEISLPGTPYKLEKRYINTLFTSLTTVRVLFTHATLGNVYLMDNGCIMVELPDHTALAYDIVIPFVNKENGEVDATFSGKQNTESYQYNRIIGCGALCYYLTEVKESDIDPASRLVVAGETSNGESLYLIKDDQDQVLKDLYNDKNTVAYYSDSWQVQATSKYTYEEFIAYRPYMYWQDPLGRWIEFKNQRFVVAAEMCKPVLYLYPTQTADLEVRVHPNGGFTYTDPVYGRGWSVTAQPDGSLTDRNTGKDYPYLFWEGVGLNYPTAATGWVVSREALSPFFDSLLPRLGLQGREIDDFKAYWVDRLQGSPYHHLTFLSKEQFDEIAPLEIDGGDPQSVIRVMMTATPMNTYAEIPPQVLPETPHRNGFTVVEWGGVVLR